MNILFLDLTGINYPGGCEKYLASLANYFSKNNQVTILQSKQYFLFIEYLYHFLSGYKIGTTKFLERNIGNSITKDVRLSVFMPFTNHRKKLKSILNKADVIYTKNEFQELALLYLLLGKKKYSEKVIIGTHTAIFLPKDINGLWRRIHDFQYNSIFYKMFLRSAKHIHVPNSDYITQLKSKYSIPKTKISFIPYFIDRAPHYPLDLKVEADKFNILWAGRLTTQKGLDRLRNIIKMLSTSHSFNDIHITIAGEGDKQIVQELVRNYKNVEYIGFVQDMEKIYVKHDLCIVTSVFETFGYNVLEPHSFGIPVVSFDISGPRDIIIEAETGYLVKDEKTFCEKVLLLQNEKSKSSVEYVKMRKRIHSVINQKFSRKNILIQLDNLFSQ